MRIIGHISEHDLHSFYLEGAIFLVAVIAVIAFVAWLVTNGFSPRSREIENKRDDEKQESDQ